MLNTEFYGRNYGPYMAVMAFEGHGAYYIKPKSFPFRDLRQEILWVIPEQSRSQHERLGSNKITHSPFEMVHQYGMLPELSNARRSRSAFYQDTLYLKLQSLRASGEDTPLPRKTLIQSSLVVARLVSGKIWV